MNSLLRKEFKKIEASKFGFSADDWRKICLLFEGEPNKDLDIFKESLKSFFNFWK